MSPLQQPNVEIMIATAMMPAPAPPNITCIAAVPTRSSGAYWILASGNTQRYATFASRYKPITSPVPNKSESGIFRRGSRTSPAVNVMLFQASAENSEPTCPTQIAITIPSAPAVAETAPTNGKSDVIGEIAVGVQKFAKLAWSASALCPKKMPSTTNANSDSVFADVNTFWMILP